MISFSPAARTDAGCAVIADESYADLEFINPDQTTLNIQLLQQAAPAAVNVIESENIESALISSLNYRVLNAPHAGTRAEKTGDLADAKIDRDYA